MDIHLLLDEVKPSVHGQRSLCLILLEQYGPYLFVDVRIIVEGSKFLRVRRGSRVSFGACWREILEKHADLLYTSIFLLLSF
jgi:hypothetical protein